MTEGRLLRLTIFVLERLWQRSRVTVMAEEALSRSCSCAAAIRDLWLQGTHK